MPKANPKKEYDNQSISSLKGADRVRKRPGVIFGSDGLEGCEHAVFEILSNAIDEAREGQDVYKRQALTTTPKAPSCSASVARVTTRCPRVTPPPTPTNTGISAACITARWMAGWGVKG